MLLLAGELEKRGQTPEALPIQLLLAFIRQLVATSSPDALYLAATDAGTFVNASEEQVSLLLKMVLSEYEKNSIWPAGFM
jgi:hypothetical protein